MSITPLQAVRASLQAYVDKDRAAIEALLADDFRFTSPIDNALDRATYFERCWPNSGSIQSFSIVHEAENGEHAFVVYEATTASKRFRNSEMHTCRGGRIVSVEVYFGWDLPHPAAPGRFVDSGGA